MLLYYDVIEPRWKVFSCSVAGKIKKLWFFVTFEKYTELVLGVLGIFSANPHFKQLSFVWEQSCRIRIKLHPSEIAINRGKMASVSVLQEFWKFWHFSPMFHSVTEILYKIFWIKGRLVKKIKPLTILFFCFFVVYL